MSERRLNIGDEDDPEHNLLLETSCLERVAPLLKQSLRRFTLQHLALVLPSLYCLINVRFCYAHPPELPW